MNFREPSQDVSIYDLYQNVDVQQPTTKRQQPKPSTRQTSGLTTYDQYL